MQQVQEKIAQMEDDMENKFTKTDQLKEEFDQEKRRLAVLRELLKTAKPGLSKEMTFHSMKHDTKKNQILQNDIYKRINEVESKLITNESNIYGIQ